MIQLALPGVPTQTLPARRRRRASELRELLSRAERRNQILIRDLAEARAIIEALRADLAALEAERDRLARALLDRRLRLPVLNAGPLPRGPGIRCDRSRD